MGSIAIIGHGRSPEGRGWGERIDACDRTLRMWDWSWQAPRDYGRKYSFGLIEAHPSTMESFRAHNKLRPTHGWVASKLWPRPYECGLPDNCDVFDQAPFAKLAKDMGGIGETGNLQFTRGTVAATWAISGSRRGDRVVLVAFDNIVRGATLPIEEAFCEKYRANPGSLAFVGYEGGQRKFGNHDYAIEYPFMRDLADAYDVDLVLAENIWP